MEECKDESKEKNHFLKPDENLADITLDGNSLFRCLAHKTHKQQDSYKKVKSTVFELLNKEKNKLVPSVIDLEEYSRLNNIESTIKNNE